MPHMYIKQAPAGWLYDFVERDSGRLVRDWFQLGRAKPESSQDFIVRAARPLYLAEPKAGLIVDDFGNVCMVVGCTVAPSQMVF
jgi:hypothetical protein